MGLDVYMRWDGMTEEERAAQYTGGSVSAGAGAAGYLRQNHAWPHDNCISLRDVPHVVGFMFQEAWRAEAVDETFVDPYNSVEVFGRKDPRCIGAACPGGVFPARLLRKRLPYAVRLAHLRSKMCYDEDTWPEMEQALTAFVELAERKESEGVETRICIV